MPDEPTTDPQFGIDGCTCIPFTRQTNPPRYLNRPTDTVDMISGWERGRDCEHHAPVPATVRDRIDQALHHVLNTDLGKGAWTRLRARATDAVLAVLTAPVDRATVLLWAADFAEEVAEKLRAHHEFERSNGALDVMTELRRLAGGAADNTTETHGDETTLLRLTVDAVEEGRRELRAENAHLRSQLWTLAAMFEGFGRLLATSSRDWGQYAPDAWLYAVILGWDCEQPVHDGTCTHGAMEEMQQLHGWSDETVAKVRRYRAVVRTLTQPAAGAGKDGAEA